MKTMPDTDPLHEVRAAREEIARKFDYDLNAILADARSREKDHPERLAKLIPMTPKKKV
jgi:hypothetical protein